MTYEEKDLKYSFYEVSEILKYLPVEWNEKLPESFKNLIKTNRLNNNFVYNENESLDNQKMLRSTKILLSFLYRAYWCSEGKK